MAVFLAGAAEVLEMCPPSQHCVNRGTLCQTPVPRSGSLVLRESCVLLLGLLVAAITSPFLNPARDALALGLAVLVPVGFCLGRTAFVRVPDAPIGALRQLGCRFAMALALISLLLFEIGVAMFAGAKDIPGSVWAIVFGFGAAYVVLMSVARSVGSPTAGSDSWDGPRGSSP